MCIAILNNGNIISENHFKTSLMFNPDGFGMSYIENGKLQVFRSLSSDFKSLYARYKKVFNSTQYPILLHFRIGTSGGINLENCHPFYINKESVFCHNGIIDNYGSKNMSDTREFNRDILSKFSSEDLFSNEALKELISTYIGYSKFILFNNKGEFTIYNEDLGHWDNDNNWFSNKSYLPYKQSDKGWDKHIKVDVGLNNFGKCESCLEYNNIEYNIDYKLDICNECAEFYSNNEFKKW